ncbi:hypothetical protein, partial [Bifidobacterium hapali]|uniref:hypothetical protein n=1 Tax=Bifidobacterium hapali TaxID=1630172 RepID=UPI001B805055
ERSHEIFRQHTLLAQEETVYCISGRKADITESLLSSFSSPKARHHRRAFFLWVMQAAACGVLLGL